MTRGKFKAERRQQRGRPLVPRKTKWKVVERKMRKEGSVMGKGRSATVKGGILVDSWKGMEQNQVAMEEAHSPDHGCQMQTRRTRMVKGRPPEDRQPEEVATREKRAKGLGEEGCLGATSGITGQESKGKGGIKAGAGRGRGHQGRGRGRQVDH